MGGRGRGGTYIESSRKRLTLCIVMRAVELGLMRMIGVCCFLFDGLPVEPPLVDDCAVEWEEDLSVSSRETLIRDVARFRTESKFCSELRVSIPHITN